MPRGGDAGILSPPDFEIAESWDSHRLPQWQPLLAYTAVLTITLFFSSRKKNAVWLTTVEELLSSGFSASSHILSTFSTEDSHGCTVYF